MALLTLAWMGTLVWQTRVWWVVTPGLLPPGLFAWRLFHQGGGWSFVALSFLLLAAGAGISLWKGGRARRNAAASWPDAAEA